MTEEKDVKVHINEIYKLVEDLKSEKIILLKQFVAGILIQKLSKSWNDYKQNLKDKQKLLSLEDLVKHVIIKDINRQQSYFVKAKEIATKVNLVEDNHNKHNKYEKELDYKLRVNNQNFKKKVIFCVWQIRPPCSSMQKQSGKTDNPAKPRVNLAEADDIIVAIISQANIVTDMSVWVINSGATRHICANKTYYVSYTQVNEVEEVFYLGDSSTTEVIGK